MNHVGGIEAVIAQFIEQDFVGREIIGKAPTRPPRGEGTCYLINRQEQFCLAKLILMQSVTLMTNGTDGKNHMKMGIDTLKQLKEGFPCISNVVSRKTLASEKRIGLLVTIGNQHAIFLQTINIGSAESDDEHISIANPIGNKKKRGIELVEQFLLIG